VSRSLQSRSLHRGEEPIWLLNAVPVWGPRSRWWHQFAEYYELGARVYWALAGGPFRIVIKPEEPGW